MPSKRSVSKKPDTNIVPLPVAAIRGAGRDEANAYLKKALGSRIYEGRVSLEGISTGSVAVDVICGNGGFPRGRISEVFGLESSGKSTLCMTACAKAQSMGLYAVYVDVERSLMPDHAMKIGFDTTQRGAWLQPDTFEETLQIIDTMAVKGEADIVLVDSVPALVPKSVLDGEITEMGQFGQAARLFAGSLPRICKLIERTNTALVLVNQLRANIVQDTYRARFEPKEKSYGGYALRYYSSLRVELRQRDKKAKTRELPHPTERGKMVEQPVASRHTALIYKSKVSQPYKEIEFFIRFDPTTDQWGIDNLQTRLDIAKAKGLIEEKHGGVTMFTTSTGDKQTVRGADALYDWFQSRPEEIAALTAQIGV
jgi:recombination protein RecA